MKNRTTISLTGIALIGILAFTGCTIFKKKPEAPMEKLKPSQYPEFTDDMDFDGLGQAIAQSLKYLGRVSPDKKFAFGEETFDAAHITRSLKHFENFIKTKPKKNALKKFIAKHYLVYKSTGDEEEKVLFTGYYEPLLKGRLKKTGRYRFPLYARPDDLAVVDLSLFSEKYKGERILGRVDGKTFVPYHERGEIERGALQGKAKTIAWVDDPVDSFFLQIQGSGQIALPDGERLHVHYHSKNGRPYRSIGKLLIDKGKIERSEMSMQKIRKYLAAHPEEMDEILNHNPSYVFFSIEKDGPFGALNVRLTSGRSVAVDRKIFPLPALAFIKTKKPLLNMGGKIVKWRDFGRFALSQDTGGAIRGPGRVDLFQGNGEYAETAAGHLRHNGELYFLVLKPDSTG